ncbi:MAG: leucine-rich repeat domain-containing protein, partial [Clostridia bacterium]|nr:leucine-rich repeat domain-containing protein [Clostridia bacterium]
FALAGKCSFYSNQIENLISQQGVSSKINKRDKTKNDIYKVSISISVVCALTLIVTMIVGMSHVHPLYEFWLLLFNGNIGAFLGVGIPLVILLTFILLGMLISAFSGEINLSWGWVAPTFIIPALGIAISIIYGIIWVIVKLNKLSKIIASVLIIIIIFVCFGVGISKWTAANAEQSSYYVGDGYIIEFENDGYNGYTVKKYNGNNPVVEIPQQYRNKKVTAIGSNAFRDSNVRIVKIPSSVTSIGYYAFGDCRSLTSIEIPSGVTSIDDRTFSGCSSLLSIEIPSSVTSIGEYAVSFCDSLTSIEIPSSVTSIGEYAFSGCDGLTRAYIPQSVVYMGKGVFSYSNIYLIIYCEARNAPSGWDSDWNRSYTGGRGKLFEVVWGYKSN